MALTRKEKNKPLLFGGKSVKAGAHQACEYLAHSLIKIVLSCRFYLQRSTPAKPAYKTNAETAQ